MRKEHFDITGMTCSACSSRVESCVRKLPGVKDVSVNLLKNSMSVSYDENSLNTKGIVDAVEGSGYGAKPKDDLRNTNAEKAQGSTAQAEYKAMKQRLWLSVIFTLPLFYISMGHMMNWPLPSFLLGMENAMTFAFTQFLLLIPVLIINGKYYKGGFRALFHGSPNMDSLIAIGSGAATVYGIYAIYKIGVGLGSGNMELVHSFMMDLYFESAAMILTLITLGKTLEARAKGKTSDAITKLMNLAPKVATVVRDGQEIQIPVDDVVLGDVLIVKAGESVPVDGIVLEGFSAIDESALTGESIPVEKNMGDKVIGATVSKSGYIKMQATKVGDDTALSQIIRLVDEATSSKAPIAKLADKVSGVFVPIVIGIALISTISWLIAGYGLEFALSIGISVLVISCPCALGLATPTAIMVGIGKGAENGILIKNAESLEVAEKVNTVVLDKTGTLTEGHPQVTDALWLKDEVKLKSVLLSLEKMSEHPLAEAVVMFLQDTQVLPVEHFCVLPGRGVEGYVDGKKYKVGNLALAKERKINVDPLLQTKAEKWIDEAKTVIVLADEEKALGVLAITDRLKDTSIRAIEALHKQGIDVWMLTGDQVEAAGEVAKQVGITHFKAGVLPQDKASFILKSP